MFTPKNILLDKILYGIIFYSKSLFCESTFKMMIKLKGTKLRAPSKSKNTIFFNIWGALNFLWMSDLAENLYLSSENIY